MMGCNAASGAMNHMASENSGAWNSSSSSAMMQHVSCARSRMWQHSAKGLSEEVAAEAWATVASP